MSEQLDRKDGYHIVQRLIPEGYSDAGQPDARFMAYVTWNSDGTFMVQSIVGNYMNTNQIWRWQVLTRCFTIEDMLSAFPIVVTHE